MLRNYFLSAWRNITANSFYSLLNIAGLAVGLATGIVLLLWVQDEMSFDRFNKDYHRIYNVSAHFPANGKEVTWTSVPGPLSIYAQSNPHIQSLVRIQDRWGQVLSNNDRSKVFDDFHMAVVDTSFLSIFDYTLMKGSPSRLFADMHSIVLTAQSAKRFFGTANPMGQTLLFDDTPFTVTGILQDFPENSSLQYDALLPMAYYGQQFTAGGGNSGWKTIDEDLGNYAFQTFVKLTPGSDPAQVGTFFTQRYTAARNGDSQTQFRLQNLADIHLISADGNDSALQMVHIFRLVAIILLVIAAINYINLTTARAMVRAKEVGIRKIIGAGQKQLFFQFIIETLLLFGIAVVLAAILMTLLLPLYNNLSGKDLQYSLLHFNAWRMIAWAIVGTLLAAGIYPALLLSAFRPAHVLQGQKNKTTGAAFFRKILVVFQFLISVVLIISTLVIGQQMRYVRNKNLGYDKSYVFTVAMPGSMSDHIDAVKNELRGKKSIRHLATSNIYDMSAIGNSTGDISWPGKPDNNGMIIGQAVIDKDFIPTMKMQFLEGGNFAGTPADSAHYILNETAVKAMGLKPPYVGQPISFHGRKGTIIGVLKDFNFQSLKAKITPLLFYSWNWKGNMLYVRTTAQKAQQAIAAVKSQYMQYAKDMPFRYNFVDKQFEAKYETDVRTGHLFMYFATIAIVISCLGLLGLAAFTAQRRTKEIGIRKVLGASVASIIGLICRDFFKLVLIAIIIALPVAWLSMNHWLSNFAYRTHIGWWIFMVAGCMAVLIAFLTVSWQAVRAAKANPVNSLRSE